MIKKHRIALLSAFLMIVAAAAILIIKKHTTATGSNERLPVALRLIPIREGWGYEVLVDNKVYIHQDCIPAISTFKPFATAADAALIGKRVVARITQGRKPVISLQDIRDAHIRY